METEIEYKYMNYIESLHSGNVDEAQNLYRWSRRKPNIKTAEHLIFIFTRF